MPPGEPAHVCSTAVHTDCTSTGAANPRAPTPRMHETVGSHILVSVPRGRDGHTLTEGLLGTGRITPAIPFTWEVL